MSDKNLEICFKKLSLDAPINILNDDCLLEIFRRLPIADKVRIERVCKRWKDLCDESWKNFKKLDLLKSTWGMNLYDPRQRCFVINLSFLKKHHAGEYVTSIDFSCRDIYCNFGNKFITDMANNCPNLEELHLIGWVFSKREINLLAQNCSKIRKLSLGHFNDDSEEEVKALFLKNENLSYLRIVGVNKLDGSCLFALPADNVQELFIEKFEPRFKCSSLLKPRFLSAVIMQLANLKALGLYMPFHCADDFIVDKDLDALISAIMKHANTLKYLRFSYFNFNHLFVKKPISKLVHLETLDVSESDVKDEFLIAVGAACKKLKKLNISGCDLITNEGLAATKFLPELENLNISYLKNVTDAGLENLPSLKVLECKGCNGIAGINGLSRFIDRSTDLELLDVSDCLHVSSAYLRWFYVNPSKPDTKRSFTVIDVPTID